MTSNYTEAIEHLSRVDKRLAKVISLVGAINYKSHEDGFAFLVHEIIEQMLSVKAGAKIYSRLLDICKGSIAPETILALTDEQIKSIGTSSRKVKFIQTLSVAVQSGELHLESLEQMSDEDAFKVLTSIHGIGEWTANMYLLFVLERPDILPTNDVAFQQSYKWMYKTDDVSALSIKRRCRKWKPYSSVASRYLYRALDMGFTKDEFHLFK
jgi:DNA-3-methyladenine glycosylase II